MYVPKGTMPGRASLSNVHLGRETESIVQFTVEWRGSVAHAKDVKDVKVKGKGQNHFGQNHAAGKLRVLESIVDGCSPAAVLGKRKRKRKIGQCIWLQPVQSSWIR